MKKTKKNNRNNSWVFLLLICIAMFFLTIGYAAINPIVFDISGEISADTQDDIFITDVEYVSDVNTNESESKINSFYQTLLESEIALSPTDPNSSITYSVTFYNKNDMDFDFIDVIFDEEFYDNKNIEFEITNVSNNNIIDVKDYMTLEITFKYVDGVDMLSPDFSNTLNSYLNFRFLHLVEYIESTGTQYIDTEITSNSNASYDIEFSLNSVHSTQAILGTRKKMSDGVLYNLFVHVWPGDVNAKIRWDENLVEGGYALVPLNERKKIIVNRTKDSVTFSSNGVSVTQDLDETADWSFEGNIYVFNQNQTEASETRSALMRLYSFNMYNENTGEKIREYKPVLDKQKVPCLFDLVSNTYFYNVNSDKFVYSETDDTYEYIENTGTQYVDLGIIANQNTQIELVVSFNSLYTRNQGIFGARAAYGTDSFNVFWVDSALRMDYDEGMYYPNDYPSIINPIFIRANSSGIQINDVLTKISDSDTFDTNGNMYVFAVNTVNVGEPTFITEGMKVYYIKVRQDGNIVKNLVPAKDANGVACFYDIINEEYVYASGSGNFIISEK